MPRSSLINGELWRLLLLAFASFSLPIIIAAYSTIDDIEGLPSSNSKEDLEKNDNGEQNRRRRISDSAPPPPESLSHSSTQTRKSKVVEKSYSVEESSCENGVVYLPENKEIGSLTALGLQQPFVIAMVGLPARGKSHIVKMMIRYLRWTGFEAQLFNVGSYRRRVSGLSGIKYDFFSSENEEAKRMREEMARKVQNMMYEWLHVKEVSNKCRVAIFDATNTTKERRQDLCDRARSKQVGLLFVESICDDKDILEANYLSKLKNDDYREMDSQTAKEDFIKRVKAYEEVYEPIDDSEDDGNVSYIKLINVGQKVISRKCHGYLPSQVAFYLQNVHISPRTIYLTLPAENSDSVMSILGGDNPRMTPNGRSYSMNLSRYLAKQQEEHGYDDVIVLTGTARVHAETASHLRLLYPCYSSPLINELRGGSFHGMKREDIKKKHLDIYEKRQADKLNFRYPGVGGESYQDVIERVRPIIIELERQRKPVLVICHLAVMRCIYGYFTGTPMEDIPYLDFERHRLYTLTPGAEGCQTSVLDISDELLVE